jgi:hypothetical protein
VSYTFQIFGCITEPNKLGAKFDEMLHQGLQKESWEASSDGKI